MYEYETISACLNGTARRYYRDLGNTPQHRRLEEKASGFPAKVHQYDHIHLDHEGHLRRAEALSKETILKGKDAFKKYGCKGISILSTILPYIDLSTVFLVPIAHALLYGVVASFIEFAFRKVPVPEKGKVKSEEEKWIECRLRTH